MQILVFVLGTIFMAGCGSEPSPVNPPQLELAEPEGEIDVLDQMEPVRELDLQRWLGRWYQVAHIPAWFDAFCVAGTTAEYSLNATGDIRVENGCFDADGELETQTGVAKVTNPTQPSKLSVAFFGLDPAEFGANYWVLYRSDAYDYAVVGEPGRDFGWVLSRSPGITQDQLDLAALVLTRQG